MNRSIIVIAVFFLLAAVSNLIGQSVSRERVVNARSGLRVRDKPDLTGKKIGLIPDKTKVELIIEVGKRITLSGKTGKWSQVKWNGKTGWVFGGFLVKPPIEGLQYLRDLPDKYIALVEKNYRVYKLKTCWHGLFTLTISKGSTRASIIVPRGEEDRVYTILKIVKADNKTHIFTIRDTFLNKTYDMEMKLIYKAYKYKFTNLNGFGAAKKFASYYYKDKYKTYTQKCE